MEGGIYRCLTATVCNYTSLPHILQALLFNQSAQRVKRSSCFERSYPLLVLALEEQPDFGLSLAIRGYSVRLAILTFTLCRRGYGIERFTGHYRCSVDVWFDALVGGLDGLSG